STPAPPPTPRVARSPFFAPRAATTVSASSSLASGFHSLDTTVVPFAPSTTNSDPMRAPDWCKLRHPSFQMAERVLQRLLSPVSRSSNASAKLDLPLPLRPTT